LVLIPVTNRTGFHHGLLADTIAVADRDTNAITKSFAGNISTLDKTFSDTQRGSYQY